METMMVHARLPAPLMRAVDHWAVEWGVFRQEAMALLLAEALATRPAFVKEAVVAREANG